MGVLVELIRQLPLFLRYPLTLLLFWPSILLNRIYCHLFPVKRRLWDKVHPHIVLGSAPVLPSDVARLRESLGVTAIVNTCWEWGGDPQLYAQLGLRFCHAPTLDFEPPAWRDTLRAVEVMREVALAGGTVFVHCKAGKGRSVCVVLAYLVLHEGLSARQADAAIRAKRPHIASKWGTPLLQAVEGLAASSAPRAGGLGSGGGGGGGGGGAGGDDVALLVAQDHERLALRTPAALEGSGAGATV